MHRHPTEFGSEDEEGNGDEVMKSIREVWEEMKRRGEVDDHSIQRYLDRLWNEYDDLMWLIDEGMK